MADQLYYSLFTDAGLTMITDAIRNGKKLGITHMAFGDGNGTLPVPSKSVTKLVKEVYRMPLNSLSPDPQNANWLRAEAVIASAIGGFNIRELGLYAGDTLVAYSNYPPTYKPSPSDGTARIMTFRMVLQIDNTANFELVIDPDVVMATIGYVDENYKNSVQSVESIADLNGLQNPKNGQTVYVKSFYKGLNKGGGTFIYDSSKTTVNDVGLTINGWVRQTDPGVYNVLWFGAKGDGITNDHEAFNACSRAINAAKRGTFVVPHGNYIVGKQYKDDKNPNWYARAAWKGVNVVDIVNCESVIVRLENPKIKFVNGLKYGRWNPDTDTAEYGEMPYVEHSHKAFTGVMFFFAGNKSISVEGGCELDGNLDNYTLGGEWGDTGRQLVSYGFQFLANTQQSMIGHFYIHHFGCDGLYVGGRYDDGIHPLISYDDTKPNNAGLFIGVYCDYNARQGLSQTGGGGITYIGCKFNNTGQGRFASLPMCGVDVEAESGDNRSITFINCEMINNKGQGIIDASASNQRITYDRCKVVGKTAAWIMNGHCKDCIFYGTVGFGFDMTQYNIEDPNFKPSTFENCVFTDDISLTPYTTSDEVPGLLSTAAVPESHAAYALFKNCEWHTYNRSDFLGWINGNSDSKVTITGGKWIIHKSAQIPNGHSTHLFWAYLKDFEFIDKRTEGVEYPIYAQQMGGRLINVHFTTPARLLKPGWMDVGTKTDYYLKPACYGIGNAVANATGTDNTATQLNALLAQLRAANVISN